MIRKAICGGRIHSISSEGFTELELFSKDESVMIRVDEQTRKHLIAVLGTFDKDSGTGPAGECLVCGKHHGGPCRRDSSIRSQGAPSWYKPAETPAEGKPSSPKPVSPAGVTRSAKARLSLVPASAIRAIARRLEFGISKGHEENNWRKGVGDETTRAVTLDHLIGHVLNYNERGGADQLDAIITNAAFLVEYEEAVPYEGFNPDAKGKK